MFTRAVAGLLLVFAAAEALANVPAIVVGQVYTCANGRSIKVLGCTPDGSVCDVQSYDQLGQPVVRGKNTLAELQGALAQCPARGTGLATASSAPPAAPAPSARLAMAGPPRPGLASCAGKFEGRYASQAGSAGLVTITFRSGKATVREPDAVMRDGKLAALYSEREAECWYGGGKIYLRWLNGDTDEFPIDVNDDETLDTTYGELKKKGS